MTRKDYQTIAHAIQSTKHDADSMGSESMRLLLAEELARVLAADNPRFDRARFLTACGVPA